jgi:hypothetical protein
MYMTVSSSETLPENKPTLPQGDVFASQTENTARFYTCLANAEDPYPYLHNAMLYSHFTDSALPSADLIGKLDSNDRCRVFTVFSELYRGAATVESLFPTEYGSEATSAYEEHINSMFWAIAKIARDDGASHTAMQLKNGGEIRVRGFTLQEALQTIDTFRSEMNKIICIVNDRSQPVIAVNQTGSFGMYRLGKSGEVICTARLVSRTTFDKAIEYGHTMRGTEASIGYTTDTAAGGPPSAYRQEQRNPFSIRIDNEGDRVSLDVGSILGRPGTLGKDVADLIAIGDSDRVDHWFRGEISKKLNHCSDYFGAEHANPETFARAVGGFVAELQNRWQANRAGVLSHLVLQAGISDALPLQSEDSL